MLLYIGEPYNSLITAQVGTGDNLTAEDIKEGFKDYWLSSVYTTDGEDITLLDSGQILTSTPITEIINGAEVQTMDEGEALQRVLEYWEMTDATYTILEH